MTESALTENVVRGRAALLVMDVQSHIVSRLGEAADGLMASLNNALGAARAAHMPVIYVVVRFRSGYPEISPNNKSFSAIMQNKMPLTEADAEAQIHPAVAPRPEDIVVTKRRISAFTGSDLEVILRGLGIETLVLCGIATSGVVLSTVREAADKDYRLVVLADGCWDSDAEVYRVLLEKVFPRQADVLTVQEWSRYLL